MLSLVACHSAESLRQSKTVSRQIRNCELLYLGLIALALALFALALLSLKALLWSVSMDHPTWFESATKLDTRGITAILLLSCSALAIVVLTLFRVSRAARRLRGNGESS